MPNQQPPDTLRRRIPGLTGIEHIGLTVPSIAQASGFFADLLGAETLYDIGPFASPDDWMANHLAMQPGTRIHRIRVLKIAQGPVLELFEFATPDAVQQHPVGVGGFHIAFYVEDMETALAALKSHAVEIQSGPVEMTEGPTRGMTWLYFTSPWGQQLELVSYPRGLAAYAGRTDIWRPAP